MAGPGEEGNDEEPSWTDVATFLRTGKAYRENRVPHVIETHISVVFLLDDEVYKLKKPVRFDFLDFSSSEARHLACEREVTLNRRLAPDVYLAVTAVTVDDGGGLTLGGAGRPVEWVVKMRRLPTDRMLDVMIESEQIARIDVANLARILTRFYAAAAPACLDAEQLRRSTMSHVRGNLLELLRPEHGLPENAVRRVHGRQLQFVNFETELFDRRVAEGRIVDGHGDLRPEHVCMEDTPVVFDCIEFNDEFRRLDVADELSFLAMECDRLGAPEIGESITTACSEAMGDRVPGRLLEFYKSYRACVRGKVEALRARQLQAEADEPRLAAARSYLQVADRSFGWSSRSLCLIVRGLMGTGKSTIASTISDALGAALLQTDRIRQGEGRSKDAAEGYAQGRYAANNRVAVYERMFEQASELLAERVSVVLDACFLSLDLQQRVRSMTQGADATLLVVNCHCSSDLAVERIIARARNPECLSEARPEHLKAQMTEDEGPIPGVPVLAIDTSTGTTASHVRVIMARLRQLLEPLPASKAHSEESRRQERRHE